MKKIILCLLPIWVISIGCAPVQSADPESDLRESNKQLAVNYITEVVNKQQLALIDTLFSPDYTFHEWNGEAVQNLKSGALLSFLEYLFRAFPDLQYTVVDAIAEGDRVALNLSAEGTHRDEFLGFEASGNKVIYREMFFFKMKDNKITEGWAVVDVDRVKSQLQSQ
ncbi:ester cyclase [Flavilitoribacter nigricans]|uniref:Ester cyclase n=1 Tax=Flavilitoribacter nigricans (strain ATCC 23147 / DSM 23189 / NBRC 102662 / NCIMB 1420 / SS-2) TaxID=1122177 RepID=A0A2D0NC34_FLAN2|nr:ester cyclase [Flavilitoribacter nigricans]PHN05739.1 hypothetical protein CRP01_14785 [Flavilitoribacter nigricans DSM 23189 = NBRC 102662]